MKWVKHNYGLLCSQSTTHNSQIQTMKPMRGMKLLAGVYVFT